MKKPESKKTKVAGLPRLPHPVRTLCSVQGAFEEALRADEQAHALREQAQYDAVLAEHAHRKAAAESQMRLLEDICYDIDTAVEALPWLRRWAARPFLRWLERFLGQRWQSLNAQAFEAPVPDVPVGLRPGDEPIVSDLLFVGPGEGESLLYCYQRVGPENALQAVRLRLVQGLPPSRAKALLAYMAQYRPIMEQVCGLLRQRTPQLEVIAWGLKVTPQNTMQLLVLWSTFGGLKCRWDVFTTPIQAPTTA